MQSTKNWLLGTTLVCIFSFPLAFATSEITPQKHHFFFLGADVGGSLSLGTTDLRPDFSNPGIYVFIIPNNTRFQRDIGSSSMVGAFLGYQVNDNMDLSLNYDYRGGYQWEILSSLPNFGVPSEIFQVKNISIQTLLLNVILKPSVNWGGFVPYVNAGLGLAFNKLGTLQNTDIATVHTYNTLLQGRSTTNFAWDAGVGADYRFWKKMHLAFGYRFVSTGALQSTKNFVDTVPGVSSTINPFKARSVLLNEFYTALSMDFSL